MPDLAELVRGFDLQPIALVDIGLTALLIYGLFLLLRGTRAVRLVIGVTVLVLIYLAAAALGLKLLTQILQTGAVVGLLALVVVFQPSCAERSSASGGSARSDGSSIPHPAPRSSGWSRRSDAPRRHSLVRVSVR
jgi:DNA integrity scanning protein DisA with diadenylate cyclase activity